MTLLEIGSFRYIMWNVTDDGRLTNEPAVGRLLPHQKLGADLVSPPPTSADTSEKHCHAHYTDISESRSARRRAMHILNCITLTPTLTLTLTLTLILTLNQRPTFITTRLPSRL